MQQERAKTFTPLSNVVVLGASGMLGTSWRHAAAGMGDDSIRFLDRSACDVGSAASIEQALSDDVDFVVNCTAYTNVDGAEANEEEATAINGHAVGRLAERCRVIGATLVHYSTDYVFNGEATTPYRVDQAREPLNAYGRSKAVGEELIEASGVDFLIIRTSWLYAAHGANFVRTIARASMERDRLRVVDDQRGRPTSADQLVDITRRLLAAGARGIYHGCDDGECTWFEFARAIAARMNPACVVEPCTSEEYPRPAKRPRYSVLDLEPTKRVIGFIEPWQAALERVLTKLQMEMRASG